MEKEDLKVLNKGEEEEMVKHDLSQLLLNQRSFHSDCERFTHDVRDSFLDPAGAAGLPSVPLAAGPGRPRSAVYRGLPPAAALLDARVVRQVHLHPDHSP